MAKYQTKAPAPRRASKRERRFKIIIYIMIVTMIISTLTMGLSMFI